MGISGVLILILGVVSLIFQSSTTVQVYGQVDLGPLVNIGPPFRSNSQDSDSDGTDIFIAYGAQGVHLGKIISGSGGRGESQPDEPELIIPGATDPAIDVTPGGQVYVVADQQGEIAFVECADDDDNCEPAESVSNPDTEPPDEIEGEGSTGSCSDNLDNDADGRIDIADTDCKWSSEQESSQRGLCSDGLDNDNDGVIDSDDEDCSHPSRTAGAEDTGETAGAEDTGETAGAEDDDTAGVEPTSFNLQPSTTSPQLTFVSTDGGDAPPASNTDIAASNDGSDVYVVWEQEGEIMLAASHDGGETWGAIINVSNTPGASTDPRVATSADGENVHVTWQDTPGNGDIFYARSTNGGQTFETSINLSNTSGRSDDHQLLAEGSNVYVVWVDYTTRSGGDIYFRKSINNGAPNSFSDTINLSAGSGQSFQANRDPDMAARGSTVSVTWAAYPDRNAVRAGEILFRESSNRGDTFGNSVNVSQTPRTDSKEPQVDYTPESGERYLAFNDRGGPSRVNTTPDRYNVLATESDNGRTFSALVNLSDDPDNLFLDKDTSQLEVIFDVAIWDPTSRRG